MGQNQEETLAKIIDGKYKFPPNIRLSKNCKDFISSLIHWNCYSRLSAKQALAHPWLNNGASNTELGDIFLQNIGNFQQANILKQIFVKNLIEDLDSERKQILIRAFREMDKNNLGYIGKTEVALYLTKALAISQKEAEERASSMMKIMDPKGTGKITLSDYVKSQLSSSTADIQLRQLSQKIFIELDVNNEGYLLRDQVKDYISLHSLGSDPKDVDNLIEKLDTNGDGHISLQEFQSALES